MCACLVEAFRTINMAVGKFFNIFHDLPQLRVVKSYSHFINLGRIPDGIWVVPASEQYPRMDFTIHPMVTGWCCAFHWPLFYYENVIQVLKTDVL
jgi:hypothetical protein